MNKTDKSKNFKFFAASRIAGGIFAVLLILWLVSLFTGSSGDSDILKNIKTEDKIIHKVVTTEKDSHSLNREEAISHQPEEILEEEEKISGKTDLHENVDPSEGNQDKEYANSEQDESSHKNTGHEKTDALYKTPLKIYPNITGWAFVEASIQPLKYELNERFLGWRPNDIIVGKFTDNVNNFQRGVLEVTRRTAVKLAEDISRTGSTSSFNPHLESAMNWFMIKPDKFWFPSAEKKYKSGLLELKGYQDQLVKKEARFFNRTDNLIPLLKTYRNLLGSCDDNLVKTHEDNGHEVSLFQSDDYFYYAQGVAKSMSNILKAIEHDFNPILKNRNGLGSIHHAIHALEEAEKIQPWLILNHDLSGMLANHRANLATAISHGRFYLGILITTLST